MWYGNVNNLNTNESLDPLVYQQAVEFIQSLPEDIQIPSAGEITMDFVEQYLTDYLMLKNPADNLIDQPRVKAIKSHVGILLKQAKINLAHSNRWIASQKIIDTFSNAIEENKQATHESQKDILDIFWSSEIQKKDTIDSYHPIIIPSADEEALNSYIAQISKMRIVMVQEDRKLLEDFWAMIEQYSTAEQYGKFKDAFFSVVSGRSLHHTKVALQGYGTPLKIFLRSLKSEKWE